MGQEGLVVTPQQKPEANIFMFSGPTKGRAYSLILIPYSLLGHRLVWQIPGR